MTADHPKPRFEGLETCMVACRFGLRYSIGGPGSDPKFRWSDPV